MRDPLGLNVGVPARPVAKRLCHNVGATAAFLGLAVDQLDHALVAQVQAGNIAYRGDHEHERASLTSRGKLGAIDLMSISPIAAGEPGKAISGFSVRSTLVTVARQYDPSPYEYRRKIGSLSWK